VLWRSRWCVNACGDHSADVSRPHGYRLVETGSRRSIRVGGVTTIIRVYQLKNLARRRAPRSTTC
jgi:hypothetical protein